MGDQELQQETNECNNEKASYDIISFRGINSLPKKFHPMIFSRWLRSLRYGNPTYKKISSPKYYAAYHPFIEGILSKPDSLIKLAVLSDDHDICLGFSCSREDVLDYIHVHTDYRKKGIAKALLPAGITTFSHLTGPAIVIWQAHKGTYKHLKFNPYA